MSLLTGFGSEADYVDALLEEFSGRLPDAREFAIQNRVVLLQSTNRVALDIVLAGFPYEERMIERATPFVYAEDVELITASAEDLVILKTFAGRHQDWSDVEGIAVRQGAALDWDSISRELESLSEVASNPDMLDQLDRIRRNALDC